MRKFFATPFVWVGTTLLAVGTIIIYGKEFTKIYLSYMRIAVTLARVEQNNRNLDA